MKIKATMKMVKELNKRIRGNYCIDFFKLLKLTPEEYEHYFIEDIFENFQDYDGEYMKIIEVVYHPEMYSIPHYLTTNDLLREYRPGDTADRFFSRVINAVEI